MDLSLINQDMLKKLLTLAKYTHDEHEKIRTVLDTSIPLVDKIDSKIAELILDYIGVPPDTTLCYLGNDDIKQYDKNDPKCQQCTGCFCRDWIVDAVFDYECGEITLDDAVERLLNWEKDQRADQ